MIHSVDISATQYFDVFDVMSKLIFLHILLMILSDLWMFKTQVLTYAPLSIDKDIWMVVKTTKKPIKIIFKLPFVTLGPRPPTSAAQSFWQQYTIDNNNGTTVINTNLPLSVQPDLLRGSSWEVWQFVWEDNNTNTQTGQSRPELPLPETSTYF